MDQQPIAPSELVLNPDGSVYHLKLKAQHIADTVLLVGDQGRVDHISKHFDNIDVMLLRPSSTMDVSIALSCFVV